MQVNHASALSLPLPSEASNQSSGLSDQGRTGLSSSSSLNSTDGRFVTGPYIGAVTSTRAKGIVYPDGDVEVSGVHRPISIDKSRDREPCTEEEKQKRAADRARSEVRRACKYFQLDHLWTITYRGPQFSRENLFRDLHKFERIVRKTFPEFSLIGVPELHLGGGINQGGYHFHFAVRGFYSVEVLRSAWWQIVGEAQGNVQVESRCQQSSSRVAVYLCKYITKDLDATPRVKGHHRYRRSHDLKVPVQKFVFHGRRGVEQERAIKTWIIFASGRKPSFEWHSEDGLRFMFRTFR